MYPSDLHISSTQLLEAMVFLRGDKGTESENKEMVRVTEHAGKLEECWGTREWEEQIRCLSGILTKGWLKSTHCLLVLIGPKSMMVAWGRSTGREC